MRGAQSQAERAYDQVVEWFEYFHEIEDPRQSGKIAYPLEEMLLQRLLAVLAGADSWVEIAEFGKKKLDLPSAGSWPSSTARRHMISSAIFLPRSMPKLFKIASSPGSPRLRY